MIRFSSLKNGPPGLNVPESAVQFLGASELYAKSFRRLNREAVEFILVYEEPRRILKTEAITYYGHYYSAPKEYIKRRV
ncbi:MAG: hypothetical protein LUQ65_04400 [Candidatus Helarchaeota archaeon]|nr:hypothetical protein [Candidatus Helarchaeota archaeon]